MQLSKTSKYAIQILGFMAQNIDKKYSSKSLSQELNIPYQYLAKIMTKLTKRGFISSTKGKYGGFSISKPIKKIKLVDIISIFDNLELQNCVLTDDICDPKNVCILHDQWQKTKCAVDNFFLHTTLYDLVEKSKMVQALIK
jgi:Rrf2 family protein